MRGLTFIVWLDIPVYKTSAKRILIFHLNNFNHKIWSIDKPSELSVEEVPTSRDIYELIRANIS